MRFHKVVWSPVEIDYLKANMKKLSKDQLCIALSKSRNALDKQIRAISGTSTAKDLASAPAFQSKVGKRKDLGFYARSGWEANVARWIKAGHSSYTSFKYEPTTFSFTGNVPPKGSALSYTPDFQVQTGTKKQWLEVKGNFLRGSDKTKLRRFKKFYPEEFKDLVAVVSTRTCKTADFFRSLGVPDSNIIEYNKLNKLYKKVIPNWE